MNETIKASGQVSLCRHCSEPELLRRVPFGKTGRYIEVAGCKCVATKLILRFENVKLGAGEDPITVRLQEPNVQSNVQSHSEKLKCRDAECRQCARCGEFRNCQRFTVRAIAFCEECLGLLVDEWSIR